jgi:hypothetical protein
MRMPLPLAIAAFMIVGCAGQAAAPTSSASGTDPRTASAAPSSTPPASSLPTTEPIAATTAPAGPTIPATEATAPAWTPRPAEALLTGSGVYVLVDRLNVRARPTVDANAVGVVERGDFLLIDGEGPFFQDGYTWYHAVFLGPAGEPPSAGVDLRESDGIGGWIATSKGTTKYVKALGPRCPDAIDVANMRWMLGSEQLACFGSNTIELTGTFGCGGCGGARLGIFEPAWLAYPANYNYLATYPIRDEVGSFAVRFAPGGPEAPANGSVIRIRGHFDDPAAATCAISMVDPLHPNGETLVPIPSDAAHLYCAQQFVVETFEILGTDPGFSSG